MSNEDDRIAWLSKCISAHLLFQKQDLVKSKEILQSVDIVTTQFTRHGLQSADIQLYLYIFHLRTRLLGTRDDKTIRLGELLNNDIEFYSECYDWMVSHFKISADIPERVQTEHILWSISASSSFQKIKDYHKALLILHRALMNGINKKEETITLLNEYVKLLERHIRKREYRELISSQYETAEDYQYVPSKPEEDIILCLFHLEKLFDDQFAKNDETKGYVNKRFAELSFHIAKCGCTATLCFVKRFECYREASLALDEYLTLSPMNMTDPFVCLLGVRLHLIINNDAKKALDLALLARKVLSDPDLEGQCHYLLGLCYGELARQTIGVEKERNRNQSLQNLSNAVELDPTNDKFLYALAFATAESRDIEKSLLFLRKSIKLNNSSPNKWHLLILLKSCSRDFQSCLKLCDLVLKESAQEELLSVLFSKAIILSDMNKFDEALKCCHLIFGLWASVTNKVSFKDHVEILGANSLDKRKSSGSIFFDSLEKETSVSICEGSMHVKDWISCYPKSFKSFKRELERNLKTEYYTSKLHQDRQFYNLFGFGTTNSFGDYKRHRSGLSPADFLAMVWRQVSTLFIKQGLYTEALSAAKEANNLNELCPANLAILGTCYSFQGDIDKAQLYFVRALAISSSDISVLLAYAHHLSRMSKTPEIEIQLKTYLDLVLSLDPNNNEAKSLIVKAFPDQFSDSELLVFIKQEIQTPFSNWSILPPAI
ncbi:TPR-like protein [Rozella allomycis CSF55]|uniref:TPR-like protein n=1 Tax=Rozella allomycis (strain CSF55) TaxID=988480 RepID=A0A4V1J0M7_ROZAC|nr:TPR-like protein [Rozella allomycis CSF55]